MDITSLIASIVFIFFVFILIVFPIIMTIKEEREDKKFNDIKECEYFFKRMTEREERCDDEWLIKKVIRFPHIEKIKNSSGMVSHTKIILENGHYFYEDGCDSLEKAIESYFDYMKK